MTITDGKNAAVDPKASPKPPETSVETFTKAQVEESVRKARSDALAEVGRIRAEAEKSLKAAQAAQERIARMERERQEAEIESFKDDPSELKRIRAEQKARQEAEAREAAEAKLNETSARLQAYEAERSKSDKERKAREIATRLGVDAEKVVKIAAKLTDATDADIEEIAQDLPRSQPPQAPLKPDSNRNIGGILSDEQIRDAYIKNPYDFQARQRYNEMKARTGR